MQAGIETPCLRVPMCRLDGADAICEIWYGSANARQGQGGAIHYRHDDDVLFGVIELSEAVFAPGVDQTPLQQATESACRQILALIDALNYPYLQADVCRHDLLMEIEAGAEYPLPSLAGAQD